MIVFMLLVQLLPAMGKDYSVINAQPLLLNLANQQPDKPVSVIVQKTTSVKDTSVEQVVQSLGGTITSDLHIINAFSATLPAKVVPQIGQLSGVRWVSDDSPMINPSTTWTCTGCEDNSKIASRFDVEIKADQVWNRLVNGVQQPWLQGNGINVAVVDSGVNPQQDLYTQMGQSRLKTSVAFNDDYNKTVFDGYGHGTHVAGVISGNGNRSGYQYPGVAPQSNIINVKVSNDNGGSTASNVVKGLQWINDNRITYNIKVVNISLNSSTPSSYNTDPLDAAVEILWFNGVVVVTSAGNNGTANLYAPANDPFVITVGAVDDKSTTRDASGNLSIADDTVAPFSAYGKDANGGVKPDLVAPGTKIISLAANTNSVLAQAHPDHVVPGTSGAYFSMSGTSFAAPMVAGAAAILLQSEPGLNPDQVKYRLMATARQNKARWSGDTRPIWSNYDATKAGAGYLDVYAAVTNKLMGTTPNTGKPASKLLSSGTQAITWGSVNWSSVNWSSVNWSSVNWSSDYWGVGS